MPRKRTVHPHTPATCLRDDTHATRWTVRFVCPHCGRETYQNKNAISDRRVWCDGVKLKRLDSEVDLLSSQVVEASDNAEESQKASARPVSVTPVTLRRNPCRRQNGWKESCDLRKVWD